MKKKFKFFAALLVIVTLLNACNGGNNQDVDNKFVLEGLYEASDFIEIDFEELEDMQSRKLNFMLYIGDPSCGGCNLFSPIYRQFAIDYGLKLYYITPSTKLKEVVKIQYTPSLAPFQEGEPVIVIDPHDDEKPFASVSNLKDFTTKYFTLPSIYEVSEETLDEKIANNEEFVIYYFWKYFGDCARLANEILNEYQINHQGLKNFYYIEVDPYRSEGRTSEAWQTFANKYELDRYKWGVVPTFQYRKGSEIVEMAVYLNDTIETTGDDNIKVTQSFYEDAPYLNETMNNDEFKEASIDFHNTKILEFFNRVLPLVQN